MNIYDKFLTADGHIKSFMGLLYSPNYDEYGLEDLEKRLRSYNLLENKIDEFKSKWISYVDRERQKLYQEIEEYLRNIDLQKAELKLYDANNYFLLQRLYISDDIIETLFLLRSDLGSYIIGVKHLFKYNSNFEKESQLRKSVDENLIELRIKIREELKIGYYKDFK